MMISVVVRQTTVTVTDDLDGSGNAKEVTFGGDGSWWTIDLNAKNRASLEKALSPTWPRPRDSPRGTPAAAASSKPGVDHRAGSSAGPRRGTSRGTWGRSALGPRATVTRPAIAAGSVQRCSRPTTPHTNE